MSRDNKYDLFNVVHYKDAQWWVTGIRACIGYEAFTWTYQLTKPVYQTAEVGDHGWLGGRLDVDTAAEVKEHEILSGGDAVRLRLEELKAAKDQLLKSIADLERQEAKLVADLPL